MSPHVPELGHLSPLARFLPPERLTRDGAAWIEQEPALPRISWGSYEQTAQLVEFQQQILEQARAKAAEVAAMIETVCWASLETELGVLVTYLGDAAVRAELSADVEPLTIAYRWEPHP